MADGQASAQQEESFEDWLSCRMRQIGLDEDVFGSYVTGVLDSEDTDEDRKDALIGILEGMTVTCRLTRASRIKSDRCAIQDFLVC